MNTARVKPQLEQNEDSSRFLQHTLPSQRPRCVLLAGQPWRPSAGDFPKHWNLTCLGTPPCPRACLSGPCRSQSQACVFLQPSWLRLREERCLLPVFTLLFPGTLPWRVPTKPGPRKPESGRTLTSPRAAQRSPWWPSAFISGWSWEKQRFAPRIRSVPWNSDLHSSQWVRWPPLLNKQGFQEEL